MSDLDLSRRISRLTIAIWALGIIVAINFGYDLYATQSRSASAPASEPEAGLILSDPWAKLDLEQKLQRSSAALLIDHVNDGTRIKAVVREILKRSPDTQIFYKVGEEITRMSRDAEGTTDYGDGMLVLLDGSPASFKESYSIHDGRVPALGDITVTGIREMLAAP